MKAVENFKDWFYQTHDDESKPVVGFDKLISNHHSQMESWMMAAYYAGYNKAMEENDTIEPFYIGVEEVKEDEDGNATYSFVMDEAASKSLAEVGLKFTLYCGVAGVDMEDAYTLIMGNGEEDPVLEALKLCPDVRLSEVPELIKLRQKELEQQPDDER